MPAWRTKEQKADDRQRVIETEDPADRLVYALMELCFTIDDAAEFLSADIENLREWRAQ